MSGFENEKKFRKGKKFEKKETKGEKFRKDISSAIKELNIRKRRDKSFKLEPGSTKPKSIMNMEKSLENLKSDFRFPKPEAKKEKPPKRRVPGEQKEMTPLKSGGRAMYKSGSKGCKLAMKGKGRAYGKNS